MSVVLPGKPRSGLQSLAVAYWNNQQINAYISGNSFIVLDGSKRVLQTIYNEGHEPICAIAINEATGKIAISTSTQVCVYGPFEPHETPSQWGLEVAFDISPKDLTPACSLSWGGSEELLVAGNHLALFRIEETSTCSWEEELPNPAKSALLSFDSAYIASVGHQDRLVKVWRRLTYGFNEVRFDLSYLRHPDVVTRIKWRKPFHIEQTTDNILYTICVDGFVRIWTPADTPHRFSWQLWGIIDICSPISEHHNISQPWLTSIIDGGDFTASVEGAVQERMADDHSTDDVALDHLVAIANRNPEICLAISYSGFISAWALENVSTNVVDGRRIFNIAQIQSPCLESLRGFLMPCESSHVEMQIYCDRKSGKLNMLLHAFDGRIGVFTSNVADLFDPTTNDRRIYLHTVWSGHSAPVRKIVRNFSGQAVVSRTELGETVVWNHTTTNSGSSPGPIGLKRRSIIAVDATIHRICLLRKGRFAILLHSNFISLWDCRYNQAVAIDQHSYDILGFPLCLIILPRPQGASYLTAHIATVTSERRGIVWEVNLPRYKDVSEDSSSGRIREFCQFKLDTADDLKYILPVDPAGSVPVITNFLDIFTRDIAMSYTDNGRVDFWAARLNLDHQNVEWLSTCSTETGLINPSLASGSMFKKAALVGSSMSQLTIWDVGGAHLEFDENYGEQNAIRDLDWTSTPDAQLILAVGFQYRVILVSQMRFDYLNKGAAWAPIRDMGLQDLTPHPIGDSTWLDQGHLVIGAGNQLLVYDRCVRNADHMTTTLRLPQHQNDSWDLFDAVQRFNGPLPVFHPQFLSQCILAGKSKLARLILEELHNALKFVVPGEAIDNYLGLDLTTFYAEVEIQSQASGKEGGFDIDGSSQHEDEVSMDDIATSVNQKLITLGLPQLSGHEQIQLVDMIECIALVERQRRSMDENGARFMLFFRQHALRKGRTKNIQLSWREINWAYHSDSQDILAGLVSRQYQGNMLWEHARESGIFMWLTDLQSLRLNFEAIARNEYAKSETRSPVDCSLYYLALRKKTVLQGLWRMANGFAEQAATQRLLANNFEDQRWRTAALKNAYALLSKRRFQYAAAFFLLADCLEDATEVCLRQLKDLQLAITICRVYEGDGGPVLRKLLQDEVLSLAAREGNRWLASWAFWMLGRKDMAVRVLVTPIFNLLETPYSNDFKSRFFLTDDPALVVLYSQLRHQTLQTLRGASKVSPKVEWEFVLHSAKLYDRMGCDLLALALVRNWEFQQQSTEELGGFLNPLKLLRRRSSLVVDDLSRSNAYTRMKSDKGGAKRPFAEPFTFQEPDATSLLDSFGL